MIGSIIPYSIVKPRKVLTSNKLVIILITTEPGTISLLCQD